MCLPLSEAVVGVILGRPCSGSLVLSVCSSGRVVSRCSLCRFIYCIGSGVDIGDGL